MVVLAARQCECTSCHRTVYLKMVKMANVVLCIFYYNKKVKEERHLGVLIPQLSRTPSVAPCLLPGRFPVGTAPHPTLHPLPALPALASQAFLPRIPAERVLWVRPLH